LDDKFFVYPSFFEEIIKTPRTSSVAPGTIINFIHLEVVCMEGQNINEICSANCGSPDLEKITPDLQPFFFTGEILPKFAKIKMRNSKMK
jgi:hypothetical protein